MYISLDIFTSFPLKVALFKNEMCIRASSLRLRRASSGLRGPQRLPLRLHHRTHHVGSPGYGHHRHRMPAIVHALHQGDGMQLKHRPLHRLVRILLQKLSRRLQGLEPVGEKLHSECKFGDGMKLSGDSARLGRLI